MGRIVSHVSNNEPERLRRVLDAKYRTIGVGYKAVGYHVSRLT